MTKFRRMMTVFTLGAVGTASWFGASVLVQNVQFARAREQVQDARADLARVENLSGVFRTVGKAMEPSVVFIRVTKHESGGLSSLDLRRLPFDRDDLNKLFPDRDGDGSPDIPGEGDGDSEVQGQGSGVIMEADGSVGWIVTNNHVAGGAEEIVVTLADGREIRNAKVVGADPKSDLAVIRIDADRLIPAAWGDSADLQKGDFVLAFGAPFGMVGSMTHGIVSGFNRQTNILGPFGYEEFLQTDCPINPGNSGGPLVNLKGEVVGINSAILTGNGAFQGVGFAIPSNQAKDVYKALKETGRISRGYLGVAIFDAEKNRSEAEQMGIKRSGVVVREVTADTPAVGKLEPADVIIAIDGKPVKDVRELRNIVAATPAGTDKTFTIFRGDQQMDVVISIGEQPDLPGTRLSRRSGRDDAGEGNSTQTVARKLGLRLGNPTNDALQRFGLEGEAAGAVVLGVEDGSPAALAGLKPGDMICRIGDIEVLNTDEAAEAMAKQDLAKGFGIHVVSKAGKRFVFLQVK